MMVKVIFVHWDCKGRPELGAIQKAIDMVFDGKKPPRFYGETQIPTVDWDQFTFAIASDELSEEELGRAFQEYLKRNMDYWWDYDKAVSPLEI